MSAGPATVTVVGAGVVGASTAAALARAGRAVTLVARAAGGGETARSAGVVRLMGETPALVRASLPWFRTLPAAHGGLAAGGVASRLPAGAAADAARVAASAGREPVHVLRTGGPGGGGVTVLEPASGWVEPAAVASAMVRAALNRGAVAVRADAHAVAPAGRGWRVDTSAGPVVADAVVVAAGLGSAPLLAGAGVDLPVARTPVAAAVVATDAATPARPPVPTRPGAAGQAVPTRPAGPEVVADLVSGVLVRPHPCGALVALAPGWPTDDLGALPFAELAAATGAPAAGSPERPGTVVHAWEGAYDTTPDGRPYLGEVRPGLHAAFGLNGGGVKVAPAVGAALADAVAGGAPELLAPYRPDRAVAPAAPAGALTERR